MAKPTTAQSSFLDAKAIGQAETLGLHARFIVEGYMAGEHKSPFRGFAIEFTQHREYVPGDDIRHLDWKVLGRTERYYLKQYEQETNYVGSIVLDGSESMNYGSGSISKLQYGKILSACLSYLILQQRDSVSVTVFDTATRAYIPRTGNMASIHNIMNVLANFKATGETNVAAALHSLAGQIKRKGIVIIISDFLDNEDAILDGIQHLRFGGSEVVVFHTLDPYELNFPFKGMVEFEGLENIPKLMARPQEIKKTYTAALNAWRTKIREGCERQNCHYLLMDTGTPIHEALTGYLAFRMRTSHR
jgi:uncharacterized protein (DUF58 family)